VLLSGLSEEGLRRFVAANGLPSAGQWPDATTDAKLRARLAEIRRRGFETNGSRGQVSGVGMPVKRGDGVVAAVGLFLPTHRFRGSHKSEIMEAMRVAAAAISERMARMRLPPDEAPTA
jgi:DNA-binding IclR family transcriptional regulator